MRRLLLAGLLCAGLAPGVASAAAGPLVGFGEQDPSVFGNALWQRLDVPRMHYLVPWDVLRVRWEQDRLDSWIDAARAAGVDPVVAFGVSGVASRHELAPSPKTFRRLFASFTRRYPDVQTFVTWNEANHCSQPVCHRPDLVARYYDAMVATCGYCTIVGADVLDTPSMASFVRGFERAVKHRPRIWGLHNYLDANRMSTAATRSLLRLVRGPIWFTETGGLVSRSSHSPITFPQSVAHAARATRFVLEHLATLSPRIKRVYLYHFVNHGPEQPWDSGLLGPEGIPRPAFGVVRRWLQRDRRRRAAASRSVAARSRSVTRT